MSSFPPSRFSGSDALWAVLESTKSLIVAVTSDGTIDYANSQALNAFGYTREELLGQPIETLIPADHAERHVGLREGYAATAQPRAMGSGLELQALRRDGTTFPVEVGLTPLATDTGPWVLASIIDISARRAAETRVRALSRAHLALAELNAAILRAAGRDEVLAEACRVIHTVHDEIDTWIGVSDRRSKLLRIAASAGEIGPVETQGVDALSSMPALGRVLTASSPWICADVAAEISSPWAGWAVDHGVRAVVALPLRLAGRPLGVLTIQAHDEAVLGEEFVSVLVTMADNISFALDRLDAQEQLRRIDAQRADLLHRLVTAQENERARIAADVHDHSIQSLAALDLRLGLLRTRVAAAAPELVGSVEAMQTAVSDVVGGLRHLLFELEVAEAEVALVDQLRDALEHVFVDEDVSTSVQVLTGTRSSDPVPDLPPITRGYAVRICKEALANVRRHAGASHVVISVRADPSGVEVAVQDDGVGPTGDIASLRSAPGHRGLTGMRDRAQVVGGWCRLERANGRTTLCFWLPRYGVAAPRQ